MKPKFVIQVIPEPEQTVIWMSPKKYLDLSLPREYGRLNVRSYKQESLENLRNRMEKGLVIDPPEFEIEFDTGHIIEHSGRHRAYTAHRLGIEKIPVIITYMTYERPLGPKIKKVKVPLQKVPKSLKIKSEIRRRKWEIERL
jgi:hypothetical protein